MDGYLLRLRVVRSAAIAVIRSALAVPYTRV
jgi:hypothetical protein